MKKRFGAETEAVVDGRTSSPPPPPGAGRKGQGDPTPSRCRGPRPTPALRLRRPARAIGVPGAARVPPSGLVAGTGGVPSPAPPRGARPYMGKLCPADLGSRSCFRPRSRTFLRTGWWAARDRGTRGQARCVCPVPRVRKPSTSRPGDLGKQLRVCEPPFLCRWDVIAGGSGGLPAWLLAAAPGWRLGGWGVGEPRAGGHSLRAFSAPWRGVPPIALSIAGGSGPGIKGGTAIASCAGGGTETRDARSSRRPAPSSERRKQRNPQLYPPPILPQEEEAPSFLPGEFH